MNTIIEKYNIANIWHFTDRSNLNSIMEHGLLSFVQAQRRGVEIPAPGGNEWSHDADKRKGLDEYVHLAFVNDHPMLFWAKKERRILDPIWIKIVPSMLLGGDVLFSSGVSIKSGVATLNTEDAKKQIDFEVLFTYTDWRNPDIQKRRQNAKKSEILIPRAIPSEKILGYDNG